ncbi:MAG: hypothetical protein AABY93_07405 [Bacteroidota bacterium]
MEKEHLLFLTRNFSSLTAEEARELISVKTKFPYCQLIHNLAARGALDNQLESRDQELQVSAIYSTDRSVLKSIMAATRSQRLEIVAKASPLPELNLPQPKLTVTPEPIQTLSGDDLRAEIAQDLGLLRKLKHEFEISFRVDGASDTIIKQEEQKIKPTLEISEPNSENLIKEIKSTKKKIKPEGTKQKEQIEIINQFIKTQPTISNSKIKAPIQTATTDLTENNQAFGDNIISETLVDILLKQGKKDKALEVLKKLIWKFPQKKAYFAAQIEELKK